MIHNKTISVPAMERIVHDFTTCDVCNVKIETGNYDVAEVIVSKKVGVSYPEMTDTKETEFDLCVKCFDKHILQHLKSIGVLPRVVEHFY
jgi:hypothetical protein